MESQGAKVIPWSGKGAAAARSDVAAGTGSPAFQPLEDLFIVISDDQLEALAALFRMSPLRRAMTFEAYLAVKGYGRRIE